MDKGADNTPNPLLEAALDYAHRGWPVFPCAPKGKMPLISKADGGNGLLDATTDEEQIRSWWAKTPRANIGLRTGIAFDVLDIDGDEGAASMAAACAEKEYELPTAPRSLTGGGGVHILYRVTNGRNRAGALPKVDWRGQNGYIVAPPSVHPSGALYAWAENGGPESELEEVPQWLRDIVAPPPPRNIKNAGPVRFLPANITDGTPYGLQALDGELSELSRAVEGNRNGALNTAAFNLYQLVAGGELRENVVEERLRVVAMSIGLGENEIRGTIASGRGKGMQQPRSAPELKLVVGGVSLLQPKAKPEPEPDKPRTLALRWVTDAIAEPPPEPPVLIEGMLRAGELCVIGAPRAIGKSWMGMNLGSKLSDGEGLFLGTLPVRRQVRTLISQGELDEWGSWSRWKKLTGSGEPPQFVAETFDRWRLRTTRKRSTTSGRDQTSMWSDSEDHIDAILDGRVEATIAEHNFGVHIIDPWATYFAGSENSNDEVEAALDKLRDLANRYNVAVVIFAHFGKATEFREPEDLWRGASRLADWASTRITLVPHYTNAEAEKQGMTRQQARRYVDVHFLRRSEPTDDFSIVWDPESGWWHRWANPTQIAAGRRIEMDPEEVASRCAAAGGWSSLRKASEGLGVAERTAMNMLNAAIRSGHIIESAGARGSRRFDVPGDYLASWGVGDDDFEGDFDDRGMDGEL